MNVADVVEKLELRVLAGANDLEHEVTGGYVADLLSCVMAGADNGNLWVTLQIHSNIVAVASLLGIAAVVVAEGTPVPEDTLAKAQEQNVVILSAEEPVYELVARLVALGV